MRFTMNLIVIVLFQLSLFGHQCTASMEDLQKKVRQVEHPVQSVEMSDLTKGKELGRGSLAAVHLYNDKDGGKYALKPFSGELNIRHAEAEIEAILAVQNPQYAVQILDLKKVTAPEGDTWYMVMPYLEGSKDASEVIKAGIKEEEKTKFYECLWKQMITAAKQFHAKGYAFKDFSLTDGSNMPNNILILGEESTSFKGCKRIIVIDFGMARGPLSDKAQVVPTIEGMKDDWTSLAEMIEGTTLTDPATEHEKQLKSCIAKAFDEFDKKIEKLTKPPTTSATGGKGLSALRRARKPNPQNVATQATKTMGEDALECFE